MKTWFEKNIITIMCIGIIAILAVIIIGCIFAPSIFYDQWIWKYYWGPIVADANPGASTAIHNGVVAVEGYTIVSEITYGLILIFSIFLIYKLLKKLKIAIDWRFCLSLMPYILLGPVTRVLEDADYFNMPFVYWFISPLIYLQIAFYALFFVIAGYFIEKYSKNNRKNNLVFYLSISLILAANIFITLIWTFGAKYGVNNLEPIIFYIISCLAIIVIFYYYRKYKFISVNTMVFSGGLLLLLPGIYLISSWIYGNQWGDVFNESRFDIFVLIFTLISAIALSVYLFAKKFEKNEKISIYKQPLNLSMIIGHMIDGLTSYISIYDPLKMGLPLYVEKHPASNLLMETWPPLFPIVKFLLIIFVVYIFDILYKDELKNYQSFVNLIKIGILILGFSPGTRDLLRVTMGV
jgi:uncharacterized membrane protein